MDEGVHHGVVRREQTERFPYLGEIYDAVCLGNAFCDADKESHLHHEANLGLIVLINVGRRSVELFQAHGDVLIDEHALPRHLHDWSFFNELKRELKA